eukprot:gene52835-9547_t
MPVPHGLELDRDTMQLLNCAEDSATGHNSKVCACIGMVLSHVCGADVRTPEEADAAVGDHDTLDNCWAAVTLARQPTDAWQPWGLVVGRAMELLRCMKGSAAAGSAELRPYYGTT